MAAHLAPSYTSAPFHVARSSAEMALQYNAIVTSLPHRLRFVQTWMRRRLNFCQKVCNWRQAARSFRVGVIVQMPSRKTASSYTAVQRCGAFSFRK